jgi:hypothetical protein
MVVIQIQVGKNIVEDVLIDGGSNGNIIIENLKTKLGSPKPILAPYHLRMVGQSMTRPLGIIKNMNIHIHGIPYIATFTVLKNSVVDSSYYMLLRRPWLKDAKVTDDRGNNVITIQGNGIIKTISINKKLGAETRRPQVFVYYDLMQMLTYEEEDLIFETTKIVFNWHNFSEETVSLLSVRVSVIISI